MDSTAPSGPGADDPDRTLPSDAVADDGATVAVPPSGSAGTPLRPRTPEALDSQATIAMGEATLAELSSARKRKAGTFAERQAREEKAGRAPFGQE